MSLLWPMSPLKDVHAHIEGAKLGLLNSLTKETLQRRLQQVSRRSSRPRSRWRTGRRGRQTSSRGSVKCHFTRNQTASLTEAAQELVLEGATLRRILTEELKTWQIASGSTSRGTLLSSSVVAIATCPLVAAVTKRGSISAKIQNWCGPTTTSGKRRTPSWRETSSVSDWWAGLASQSGAIGPLTVRARPGLTGTVLRSKVSPTGEESTEQCGFKTWVPERGREIWRQNHSKATQSFLTGPLCLDLPKFNAKPQAAQTLTNVVDHFADWLAGSRLNPPQPSKRVLWLGEMCCCPEGHFQRRNCCLEMQSHHNTDVKLFLVASSILSQDLTRFLEEGATHWTINFMHRTWVTLYKFLLSEIESPRGTLKPITPRRYVQENTATLKSTIF